MLIKNICYLFIFTLVVSSEIYAEIIEVNFIYVGQKDHAALLGVKQGLDESNLQGQFLNQKYNLDIIAGNEFSNHGFAKYIAVLAALNTEEFTKLTRQLANTPVFNLTNGSDGLRRNCINNALHIIPSNKMKADALEQWQTKNSDSKAKAQAWHYSFIKFAARDLNKRFKKNHKAKMDDYSWAGWAAVKMLSDTVARTQIITAKNMLHYLKTELSFDGQKGSDMNFRVTGQLRQLVLLIENDKVVAEAPVRGVAKPPSLDSLGIVECSK
jgi:hypothetical protein